MNFGEAIEALKNGQKVQREGWNGHGMFLILVSATVGITLGENTPYGKHLGSVATTINAHVDMRTATGEMQPGWLASQTDMLADDWTIVD